MRYAKYAVLMGVLLFAAAGARAQVSVGIGLGPAYVGPPPVCAYGYYPNPPYACAPYGYYGPDYFADGVFIGAGPWFHGFYGPRYNGSVDGRGFYNRGSFGPAPRGPVLPGPSGGFRGGNSGNTFHGGGGFRGGSGRR